jgi:hypothetical protein
MTRLLAVSTAIAAATLALAACGDDEPAGTKPDPADERSDPPSKPPPGWRTVRNPRAGFTLPLPRTWSARKKKAATLIRSDDHLVSITVAADRTSGGSRADPGTFARQTIRNLPGFRGRVRRRARRVRGSPYRSASVEGRGRVSTSKVLQRITAAVFQRRGRVTYEVLVFRNARVRPHFNDPVVARMLRGFRAQAPDFTP